METPEVKSVPKEKEITEPIIGFHVNRHGKKVPRYATGTRFVSADGRKEYLVAEAGDLVLVKEDKNGLKDADPVR